MRAHIVENGLVVNTIEVEDLNFPVPAGQTLIDGSEGGIGWAYDGGRLVAPEQTAPPPITRFAPRDYLKRFTREEYAAARTHENIDVQWALDNLIGARYIDVEDPETIAGVDLMVAEGIVSPERRGDLLAPQAA